MPIYQNLNFKMPWYLIGGQIQTMYPLYTEPPIKPHTKEFEIETSDDDFLNLDYYTVDKNRHLAVLCHGLEGDKERPYMIRTVTGLLEKHIDTIAWNYRSCGGKMNRQKRLYTHGDTDDLECIIRWAIAQKKYETFSLIGFSLGGNVVLKYDSLFGNSIPFPLISATAMCVPTDLESASTKIDHWRNKLYYNYFYSTLKNKLILKNEQYPGFIDLSLFEKVKKWRDFDDFFSGPITGTQDAAGFYKYCSSGLFLHENKIPSLIINAKNDPLLTEKCHPYEIASKKKNIHLIVTKKGGHLGFVQSKKLLYWNEMIAIDFVTNQLSKAGFMDYDKAPLLEW